MFVTAQELLTVVWNGSYDSWMLKVCCSLVASHMTQQSLIIQIQLLRVDMTEQLTASVHMFPASTIIQLRINHKKTGSSYA